uniref:Collagen, type VII, alpha 1 n=1 Tax=Seriola dumerili TaxID=41447 RepID=A0A3B4UL39_SERDU
CWNGGMIFLWGFGIVVSPADLCQLPMEEGSCGRYTLRWYFNSQAQACRPFIYSGCEGNDNRFLHLEECEEHIVGKHSSELQPRMFTLTIDAAGGTVEM